MTMPPEQDGDALGPIRALVAGPIAGWQQAILGEWPSPIADAYASLRTCLRVSEPGTILWSLKDLVEILIRLPVLIMARDVIEHGPPGDAAMVRRSMLGGPLTMGSWLRVLRDELAPLVASDAEGRYAMSQALGAVHVSLARNGGRDPTPYARLLGNIVPWRNDVAHGVFRTEADAYTSELVAWIEQLDRALEAQVAARVWQDVLIAAQTPGVPVVRGQTPPGGPAGPQTGQARDEIPLLMFRRGVEPLRLSPFVSLRWCPTCRGHHAFCFSGQRGGGERGSVDFHEFARGHHLRIASAQVGGLAEPAPVVELAHPLPDELTLDSEVFDAEAVAALDAAALRAHYIEPVDLRRRLKAFIERHDSGVVWLQAPAHSGKSILVRGLADPGLFGERPLAPDVIVAAFHIRAEYRTTTAQLQEFLEVDLLRDRLRVASGRRRLRFEPDQDDPATALTAFLAAAVAGLKSGMRLLLCIDGLDELDRGNLIARCIPAASALPERVMLLLTSRPSAQLDPELAARLFECTQGAGEIIVVDPSDTGAGSPGAEHRATMRAYFERELEPDLLAGIRNAFAAFIAGGTDKGAVTCRNDLSHAMAKEHRERVQRIWQDVSDGVKVRTPKGAPRLSALVTPLLDHHDKTFQSLMQASGNRFQQFAHMTALLRNFRLSVESAAGVVDSHLLYRRYLELIERSAGHGAVLETIRRVVATLVAERDLCMKLARDGTRWSGLDGRLGLHQLARSIGLDARPARLLQVLFDLKDILRVARGVGPATSRYEIEYGDVIGAVRERWPDAIADVHRARGGEVLASATRSEGLAALSDPDLVRGVLAATFDAQHEEMLCCPSPVFAALLDRAERARREHRARDSEALLSAAIAIAAGQIGRETAGGGASTMAALCALPTCLRNRAIVRLECGNSTSASADAQSAIAMFRHIAARVAADRGLDHFAAFADYELAVALSVNADIDAERGRLSSAQCDYEEAGRLLAAAGPNGVMPPGTRHQLALVHVNRGRLHGIAGDDAAAGRDLQHALALLGTADLQSDPVLEGERTGLLASAHILSSVARARAGDAQGAIAAATAALALVDGAMAASGEAGTARCSEILLAAQALGQLAGLLNHGGQDRMRALAVIDRAIALVAAVAGTLPVEDSFEAEARLGALHRMRSSILLGCDRAADAVAAAARAVEIEQALGERSDGEHRADGLAESLWLRAAALRALGDEAGAQADDARAVGLAGGC